MKRENKENDVMKKEIPYEFAKRYIFPMIRYVSELKFDERHFIDRINARLMQNRFMATAKKYCGIEV